MAQMSCYTLLDSTSLHDSLLKAGGESKALPRQLESSASRQFRDLQGCFRKMIHSQLWVTQSPLIPIISSHCRQMTCSSKQMTCLPRWTRAIFRSPAPHRTPSCTAAQSKGRASRCSVTSTAASLCQWPRRKQRVRVYISASDRFLCRGGH